MAMIRNGKVYRNLEEQVLKNMEDIEELSQHQGTEVVANPEGEATQELTKVQISDVIYEVSSDDAVWGNIEGDLDDQLDLKAALDAKQNSLTAGSNITISGDTISATDTTYSNLPAQTGGTDVSLVTTGEKATWNAKQDELTAGANITISNNVISATGVLSSVVWGQIGGSLTDQTDLKNALDAKQDLIDSSHKLPAANVSGLATVATTGDYDDLSNKPTIPAAQIQSDYAQSNSAAVDYIKNKPDLSIYAQSASLSPVATSGSYNDLTDKPIIPVDTNTWRAVKVNGVQKLDNQITGNALDLVAGSNITLTESNGVVTITASASPVSPATSQVAGKIKLGSDTVQTVAAEAVSSAADRTYAIQINSAGQAVVNVPWSTAGAVTGGTGIDVTNNVVSLEFPSIIILGAND